MTIRNSTLALTLAVALACFGASGAHAAHEGVSLPELDAEGGQWLSFYHDRSSGRRRQCPVWRRLSQSRRSPTRCPQSLQSDELGGRRLGTLQDMVCSSRATGNSLIRSFSKDPGSSVLKSWFVDG
jgi:hypothetical protein